MSLFQESKNRKGCIEYEGRSHERQVRPPPLSIENFVEHRRKSQEVSNFLKISQQHTVKEETKEGLTTVKQNSTIRNFASPKKMEIGFHGEEMRFGIQEENSEIHLLIHQNEIAKQRRLKRQESVPLPLREKWRKVFRKIVLMNRVVNAFLDVLADIHKFGTKGRKGPHDTFIRLLGPVRRNTIAQNEAIKCLILPDSPFSFIWTLILIFFLTFTAIYLPYRLAFIEQIPLSLLIIETIVDAIFLADIIMCFITAYNDEDNILIIDRCQIAKRYLKTWFVVDLISCFPIQLFETQNKYSKALRLLRLPRLYKLLKFLRVVKILNFIKSESLYKKFFFLLKLNSGVGRLLKMLVTMSFFVHLYACFWYLLANLREFPPDCWVVQLGLLDTSNFDKYVASLYWVLQTLTTVGYGDMPAYGTSERIFTIILMIFGVGFYSYTIGNLSSIFAIIDSRQGKLNAKILALNEFAYNVKMPPHLYLKIVKTLNNNSTTGKCSYFDQESLLEELPSALKNEVMSCTHKKILHSFPFFRCKPPQFVMDVLPKFKHLLLSQDEALFRTGDLVEEIYFLLEGRVAFVTQDGYMFRNFVQGSYFGESEIFQTEQFRLLSAITMTDAEVLIIKKRDLDGLLKDYPEVKEEMRTIALQRSIRNLQAQNIARKADFKLDSRQASLLCASPGINHINEFFKKEIESTESEKGSDSESLGSSSSSSSSSSSIPPRLSLKSEDAENDSLNHNKLLSPIDEVEESKEVGSPMIKLQSMEINNSSFCSSSSSDDHSLTLHDNTPIDNQIPDFNLLIHQSPIIHPNTHPPKSIPIRSISSLKFDIDVFSFAPTFSRSISKSSSSHTHRRKEKNKYKFPLMNENRRELRDIRKNQRSKSVAIEDRGIKIESLKTSPRALDEMKITEEGNSFHNKNNMKMIKHQLTILLQDNRSTRGKLRSFNVRIQNLENKMTTMGKKKKLGGIFW